MIRVHGKRNRSGENQRKLSQSRKQFSESELTQRRQRTVPIWLAEKDKQGEKQKPVSGLIPIREHDVGIQVFTKPTKFDKNRSLVLAKETKKLHRTSTYCKCALGVAT